MTVFFTFLVPWNRNTRIWRFHLCPAVGQMEPMEAKKVQWVPSVSKSGIWFHLCSICRRHSIECTECLFILCITNDKSSLHPRLMIHITSLQFVCPRCLQFPSLSDVLPVQDAQCKRRLAATPTDAHAVRNQCMQYVEWSIQLH